MFPLQHDPLPDAIKEARVFYGLLPDLASGAYFNRLYLHWEVEAFGCVDGAYNGVVALKGGMWRALISHDPRDNARQIGSGMTYAEHTYQRNSFAFGLAVSGMDGATMADFGPDAIQGHELELLCSAGAAVCLKYGLNPLGTTTHNGVSEHIILTHAEAAIFDSYFGERWDLAIFNPNGDKSDATPAQAVQSGAVLRARIASYKTVLEQQIKGG